MAAKTPKKPAPRVRTVRPVAAKHAAHPGHKKPVHAEKTAPMKTNGVKKKVAASPNNLEVPVNPLLQKPRKNQAGLTGRELEHFRDLLLAKRRELIGDMSSMEREALRSGGNSNLSNLPIHMADMGTDNYEQEFTLNLVQKDRDLLKEINAALAKIPAGTYGLCEGTGEPIIKGRLELQPWARYSVDYQRKLERHIR